LDWSLVEDPSCPLQSRRQGQGESYRNQGRKGFSFYQSSQGKILGLRLRRKYKKDKLVEEFIIKFNKHGALASIEEGIAGLVHVSEFRF